MTNTEDIKLQTAIALQRLRAATATTPNLERALEAYQRVLGFVLRTRGRLDAATAENWQAGALSDRDEAVLSSDEYPDVCLRLIESELDSAYRPMWSFGWNAFEISVGDVEACHQRVLKDPSGYFRVLGAPKALKVYPSIVAMQIQGAGGEVLYLTRDTADAPDPVPLTRCAGRLFITILGALDIVAARDYYIKKFALPDAAIRNSSGQTLQNAWGGTTSGTQPICLLKLAKPANAIQLDGYVKEGIVVRGTRVGELPPGNAMVSFEVQRLDIENVQALDLDVLGSPRSLQGFIYGGQRALTIRGPAGELIELIEAPAA